MSRNMPEIKKFSPILGKHQARLDSELLDDSFQNVLDRNSSFDSPRRGSPIRDLYHEPIPLKEF